MDRKTEVMGWLEGLAQDDWMNWHSDSEVQNAAIAALELLKEQDNCENCDIAIEDRQPIVRCRDCKHYTEQPGEWRCDLYDWVHEGNWFCADGERK